MIPLGTSMVYGIQGIDVKVGSNQRITLDIDQSYYSNDRLTAYFNISTWNNQILKRLDFSAYWLLGDCTFGGAQLT